MIMKFSIIAQVYLASRSRSSLKKISEHTFYNALGLLTYLWYLLFYQISLLILTLGSSACGLGPGTLGSGGLESLDGASDGASDGVS